MAGYNQDNYTTTYNMSHPRIYIPVKAGPRAFWKFCLHKGGNHDQGGVILQEIQFNLLIIATLCWVSDEKWYCLMRIYLAKEGVLRE